MTRKNTRTYKKVPDKQTYWQFDKISLSTIRKNKEYWEKVLNNRTKGTKSFKLINEQAEKSANIVELRSNLSKQTCLFIRYLRVCCFEMF